MFIDATNYKFCRTEREKLYNCWSEQLRSGWLGELKLAMREYESVRDEQRRIHADVDLNVLKGARLVGMTTAGVANKQDLVAAMAPKVRLFLLVPSLLASQDALHVQKMCKPSSSTSKLLPQDYQVSICTVRDRHKL